MLVQFVVRNFRSFQGETIFKMTASPDAKHQGHIIENNVQDLKILKAAAIYGSNAAGKTNLISAISFAKKLILNGTKTGQTIPITKFKLSKDSIREPAQFEFEILYKDVLYSYGIAVADEAVREEWLFVTKPGGRETKYFERATDSSGKVQFEFGPQLYDSTSKEFMHFVGQGTRPEQPFITEAESKNVQEIKDLMHWFRNVLKIINISSQDNFLHIRLHKEPDFANKLGNFLKKAGTGIEKITTMEEPLDFVKHFPGMPEAIQSSIRTRLDGKSHILVQGKDSSVSFVTGEKDEPKILRIQTVHLDSSKSEHYFSLADESAGTQRLMHLFPALIMLIESESVFLIDELDRSLHPLLSRHFVQTYLENSPNVHSQLIFTTHEECLLDLELLRRDEIWFIQKDENQASRCYPLTDFKVRTDLEIRKGYLNGRFGAIPFFSNPAELGWD